MRKQQITLQDVEKNRLLCVLKGQRPKLFTLNNSLGKYWKMFWNVFNGYTELMRMYPVGALDKNYVSADPDGVWDGTIALRNGMVLDFVVGSVANNQIIYYFYGHHVFPGRGEGPCGVNEMRRENKGLCVATTRVLKVTLEKGAIIVDISCVNTWPLFRYSNCIVDYMRKNLQDYVHGVKWPKIRETTVWLRTRHGGVIEQFSYMTIWKANILAVLENRLREVFNRKEAMIHLVWNNRDHLYRHWSVGLEPARIPYFEKKYARFAVKPDRDRGAGADRDRGAGADADLGCDTIAGLKIKNNKIVA